MPPHCRVVAVLASCVGLLGVFGGVARASAAPLILPDTQYAPAEWADLAGWAADNHAAAFATFLASCRAGAEERLHAGEMTQLNRALRSVCAHAEASIPIDDKGARKFFEDNFRPVQLSKLGESNGFLTGYYEPIIDGSRFPTPEFHAPLYRRPRDLVASGWRKLDGIFPSKGVEVGRRVGRREIAPYYTRAQIEDGALAGWHLEICYLRSELEVLFAQIEGSARIRLADGSILRVNYDSYNGWPYTPVGRILVERGIMTRDQVTMQSIRQWMEANPEQAKDVRREDKSYVFFRVVHLSGNDEPVGAEGAPLTPGRSIAVDHALHVYGTPFFIDSDLPLASATAATRFQRLVIAQDTGSAIVGPARADIYFGGDDEAAAIAGRIKNPGRFFILLPRALDPVEAGRATPLPPDRPSAPGLAGPGGLDGVAAPAAALTAGHGLSRGQQSATDAEPMPPLSANKRMPR